MPQNKTGGFQSGEHGSQGDLQLQWKYKKQFKSWELKESSKWFDVCMAAWSNGECGNLCQFDS